MSDAISLLNLADFERRISLAKSGDVVEECFIRDFMGELVNSCPLSYLLAISTAAKEMRKNELKSEAAHN